MKDDYAIFSDDYAQKQTDKTSLDIADMLMDKIDTRNLERINSALGLSIARILNVSYEAARAEIRAGQERYGLRRAYALPSSFTARISDFYGRYVPILSGNLAARTFFHIQDVIKKAESKGLSTNEIKSEVSSRFSGIRGDGAVIIRTEGTRAISIARYSYAQRAHDNGFGPELFIYKSLMDNRTTKTCSFLNNAYWMYEDNDFSYWPPSHFFCRAGVVYGWMAGITKDMRELTSQQRVRLREIQSEEFPAWRQMKEADLFNPQSAFKPYEQGRSAGSGRQKIIDNALFDYATRQIDSNAEKISGVARTPQADAVKGMVDTIRRSAGNIDRNTKEIIQRELVKDISKGADLIDQVRSKQTRNEIMSRPIKSKKRRS